MKIKERKTCRISGGKLEEVFDMGLLPISCFPLPKEPCPELHPLKLAFSKESGLLQLCHTVDPDEMYSQYWYMSGVNHTMKMALKSIVDEAIRRSLEPLEKENVVLDISSNDV